MTIRKTGFGQITETEQDEMLRKQAVRDPWTQEDDQDLARENALVDGEEDE